jgi:hypothetical protein
MSTGAPSEAGSRPPIEDYALIGATRTAALVASDGAIDWMCVPRFDGQPIFGRLIGGDHGGWFGVGPASSAVVSARSYRHHAATVETTCITRSGRLVLTDGMVADVRGRLLPSNLLVRRLAAVGEPVEATVCFDPRLGPRRLPPRDCGRAGDALVCSWPGVAVALTITPTV